MVVCNFCNAEFLSNRALTVHQKRWCTKYIEPVIDESNYLYICICGKKFKTASSKRGHTAGCELVLNRRIAEENCLTENLLRDLFVVKNYSASEIHKFLKVQYVSISRLIFIAKSLNIKTKTIKEAANLQIVRDKYVKTCIKKYGDVNVLGKNSPKYIKRNNTISEKYGVKNVFQLDSVKEKSSETLFRNHGVHRSVDIANRYKNNGRKSKPHKKVEQLLRELNIEFNSEQVQKFHKNNYNPRA
jgi:hypothetical protein